MKAHGGADVELQSFSNVAPDRDDWSVHAPADFSPGEKTLNQPTHSLIWLQCPVTGHGQTTKLRDGLRINKMQKIKFIKPKDWEEVLISC